MSVKLLPAIRAAVRDAVGQYGAKRVADELVRIFGPENTRIILKELGLPASIPPTASQPVTPPAGGPAPSTPPAAPSGQPATKPPSDGSTPPPAAPKPPAASGYVDDIDPAKVIWLHTDVSGWPKTASLTMAISKNSASFLYDKARKWPAVDGLNANPWCFWPDGKGGWYGATFEWFRPGQTSKPTGKVFDPGHIKKKELAGFKPKSGEKYGFMVSGLARSKVRNVKERTRIVLATWP